jgi:hypothetical protein
MRRIAELAISALVLAVTAEAPADRTSSFSVGNAPKAHRARWRAWTASMLATAVLVPGAAAIATVALYLHPVWKVDCPAGAYAVGTGVGLLLWGTAFAAIAQRYAWADRAIPNVYNNLSEVFEALRTRLEPALRDVKDSTRAAAREAAPHLTRLGRGLGHYDDRRSPDVGLPWTLGVGYVDLWRSAHRAEEALLPGGAITDLVADAVFDDRRLAGSRIEGQAELRQKLRIAIDVLAPKSGVFLSSPPATPGERPDIDDPPKAPAALGALKAIRRTINEFRDDRRDGLIRVRNNLYAAMIFASVMAYALLGLLMLGLLGNDPLVGTPQKWRIAIEAGTAFYVVAALVGLFRELSVRRGSAVTEEDYGLRTARLINIPLFSGFAGLAGVALTALLPATVPQTADRAVDVDMFKVFNLEETPENVVVAAVFGLAPTLLIRGLQQRADQYKEDLKATEAGERPTEQPPA